MPTSALSLRDRLSAALLDFAWDEWGQMGVLSAPRRQSIWAQDPEALVLFTLEVARDDPRLFDETLDWLVRNESIVSARRLQTLCEAPLDERLASAALDWVARHRRGRAPRPRTIGTNVPAPDALFRGVSTPMRDPDPAFLAHGFLRPEAAPSGKSRTPDLKTPINFAFRLRHLLGVGARAETVRFLLTVDAPRATVSAVTSSAGYAKRNVQEALSSLHAAGAVLLVSVGADQRYAIDRPRWAHLLDVDVEDLPVHRAWPQLLSVLRRILRWLERPDLEKLSNYLRASQARDLLEELRPALSHAGVITSAWRSGEEAWDDLVDTVEYALLALGPPSTPTGRPATFEVYADRNGRHRWRLNAANGRVVATSADAYVSSSNARAAAERLKANARSYSFVADADQAGNHRWRANASNGQTVATSAESFSSRQSAERAARAARELASSAAGP
jgi:uncharacterized protein YegP (UPF0339 family)